MMRSLLAKSAAVTLMLCCGSAHAAWYQASSKHFVVYANDSPKSLSEFASKLERFDKAVRHVRGMDDPAIGDGNRLTVFVMPTMASVQKLYGDTSGFIGGFYKGPATGPIAYVARKN